MADPTDPTSLQNQSASAEQAAESITNYNDVVLSSVESLGKFNDQIQISSVNLDDTQSSAKSAVDAISALSDKIKGYSVALNQNNEFSRQQTKEMGLLTTAVLGTRDAFSNLANVNTDRLTTFSGQWQNLVTTFKNSGGALGGLIKQAEDIATRLGRTVPDAAKVSVSALTGFMGTMLRSADNTIKAQNALVQYAGRAGSLGALFQAAGPHLENMNELIAQQRSSLADTAMAVNLYPEQVEKFYDKLATLPGNLTAAVTASDGMVDRSMGNMSKTTSMLTATILTAIGTGRQYDSVIQDLTTAFKNYGITGESALKFSASMRQISDDNRVSIESVQTALSKTANEFGRFANAGDAAARVSQGVAEAMNQYAHALQSAGMSGDRALEVSGGLLSAMSKMDVAQRALLSQRTGGPGGLLGAAQIEKLMRDDPRAALEKMRQMVTREAGPAVSVDEAARSSEAAARQARQRALLTQGPFKVAETEQDATRMLDAMSKIGTAAEAGATTDFSKVLGTTMDRGIDIQGKSYTELQQINASTAKLSAAADSINATMVERTIGGGIGEAGTFTARQEGLRGSMAAGGFASGAMSDRTATALRDARVYSDTSAEGLLEGTKDIASFIQKAGAMGKEAARSMRDKLTGAVAKINSEIASEADPAKLSELKSAKEGLMAKLRGLVDVTPTTYKPPSLATPEGFISPADRLGTAVRTATGTLGGNRTTAETGDPGAHRAHPGTSPLALGTVNVHVTATCDHCGAALNNKTPQAQAVTVANR